MFLNVAPWVKTFPYKAKSNYCPLWQSWITTAHVKSACQGKLGTTIQNHSNNGGLFKNFDTAKFFTFNKSFVADLSFRLLQKLRLLSRQIISFVHRGYFSEHQVKTCLKNTSPRKCSEILAIPGVHVVILPLHSSPDWVLLHRSRCGDWKFPSTLYKSNTVRNHRIFADWSFWEAFSSGVLKNNLVVQKIKFVSTTDEGFVEVCNKTLIEGVSKFLKRPPSCCYVVAMVCLVVPSFP